MSKQQHHPASDPDHSPTRSTRDADQGNTEHPSQDEPPAEQRQGQRDAVTATREGMTPDSSARARIGGQYHEGCGLQDPEHRESDKLRRENADIDMYRKHFSGYKVDEAHLLSNPYIESDKRLDGAEHQHDLPRLADQERTNAHDTKANPSIAHPASDTAQGSASSRHDKPVQGIPGHTPSTPRRKPSRPLDSPRETQGEETRGDTDSTWTERVQDLKKFARDHGANLRSMPPDDEEPATFASDLSRSSRRRGSRGEDVVHSREATMALYSYPPVENGRQFFERVPEERKEELSRVKRDLKSMEERLQNATKERMSEVAAALDTGLPSAKPGPPRRG